MTPVTLPFSGTSWPGVDGSVLWSFHGHTMREPTPYRATRLAESVAPYLVGDGSGTTKLSISLPTSVLDAVRAAAAERGSTVSAVIAAAVRSALESRAGAPNWPPELLALARLRGRDVDEL